MTADEKRRLATIRHQHAREVDEPYYQKVKHFAWIDMDVVLRLLDEAIAERDAAMAALREIAGLEGHDPEYTDHDFARDVLALVNQVLAAHSAATKPEESK